MGSRADQWSDLILLAAVVAGVARDEVLTRTSIFPDAATNGIHNGVTATGEDHAST
jgi:hypothetical protein